VLATTSITNKAQFVSNGVVAIPNKELGFSKAFIVRNPDGHAIQIIQQ
jgi:hypothetical protein